MSSLGVWRGGGYNSWNPLSPSDVWDPFDFGFGVEKSRGRGPDDDVSALAHAHVDWRETDNAHVFRADLPGVRREELKVQVEDNNILKISGEKTKEKEEVDDQWHRVERQRGSFLRRFRLPENAITDRISSALKDGVLTVTVPKKTESPSGVRTIHVA
ncbi:18.1 kDa class I heat shock protein-like [Vitis riparia]|uniref:18.1 kDa class I heat shock protein-like n=1 Tax=Vitis riparia TaxID=96939 RepID=UPI00155A737A|nr:18.1 kDa class I heat shock protein-like [Vitis riparia]